MALIQQLATRKNITHFYNKLYMQNLNYQYVIAGILLLIAIVYVVRSIVKSLSNKHNCADCGIPAQKKKPEFKK